MKVLLPSITLSLLLLLSITATGSIKLDWPQSYYVSSDRQLTLWSSMVMEDIPILATYNATREFVFKQNWAKGNWTDDYWSLYNVFLSKYFSAFQIHINRINKEFGIKDLFPELKNTSIPYMTTVQCWTECPSPLEETKHFTYKLAFNDEYEVHFNLAKELWVAEPTPLGRALQKILQEDSQTTDLIVQRLAYLCMMLANLFLNAGKDVFSRQIQPEVYIVSRSEESETEIICMVTGFYPEPINVSLWKENKLEDVLSTETLPNGDGTYQITVTATVNVNEQQSVYCRVEHSSLKLPLIVHQEKKSYLVTGLVVGIGVPAIFCAIALAYYIKKYKKYIHCKLNRRYDSEAQTVKKNERYTSITGLNIAPTLPEKRKLLNCARQQTRTVLNVTGMNNVVR